MSDKPFLTYRQQLKRIKDKRILVADDDFVLVAIRVSKNNIHFARTMYVMAQEKVKKYFKHNYFYKI